MDKDFTTRMHTFKRKLTGFTPFSKKVEILLDILYIEYTDARFLQCAEKIRQAHKDVVKSLLVLHEIDKASDCKCSRDDFITLVISMAKHDHKLEFHQLLRKATKLITNQYQQFLQQKERLTDTL